jgi:hypothetical protein
MGIAEEWKRRDMSALAADWLREIRANEPPTDGDVGSSVVLMNFTAAADVQWTFLRAAVAEATTDDELCAIAAGPFEHLLGTHGENYVALVESCSRDDAKFARMTTAAYQHLMSDDVWGRIKAVQATVPDPL